MNTLHKWLTYFREHCIVADVDEQGRQLMEDQARKENKMDKFEDAFDGIAEAYAKALFSQAVHVADVPKKAIPETETDNEKLQTPQT